VYRPVSTIESNRGIKTMEHEVLDQLDGTELWRVYISETSDDTQTKSLVDDTTSMLMDQWPLSAGPADYTHKIIHPVMSGDNFFLPASYLLVRGGDNNSGEDGSCVLGHGRLTECFEGAGGCAAAATYILIKESERGFGLGRILMSLLEREAERLGYHYVYLWTQQAVPFYKKLGYAETGRVSLHRACLKSLQVEQVSRLELMLSRQLQARAGSSLIRTHETALLPPSDGMAQQEEDVWLRKRLVESVGSIDLPLSERLTEMEEAISKYSETDTELPKDCQWQYQLVRIPWQQQLGPSCGLAALRMLRDHYHTSDSKQMPSLLVEAQEKGYSEDGEVFDANNLQKLSDSVCGLDCEMRLLSDTTVDDIHKLLAAGSVAIIPYDSNPGSRLPGLLSGRSSHYGIIVGLVLGFAPEAEAQISCDVSSILRSHVDRPVSGACRVLLLVQHSLSRKLAIAPWASFVDSNQQLDTIDWSRFPAAANLNLKDRLVVVKGIQ
jgi:GNAT superfamily N-acetyltransferase